MSKSNEKALHFTIHGMHCSSCSFLIETDLIDREGIKEVAINHKTGFARIVVDQKMRPIDIALLIKNVDPKKFSATFLNVENNSLSSLGYLARIAISMNAGLVAMVCLGLTTPVIGLAISGLSVIAGVGATWVARLMVKNTDLKAYQATDIAKAPQEKLGAFLDGAQNDHIIDIKSCFSFRDWRYMRDYYAGQAAKEADDTQLIASVTRKLKVS